VILLGHIHKHQIMAEGKIAYIGSPRPTTFGQKTKSGYCLINVERGRPPEIEHRRAPYRSMVTIEAEWDPERGALVVCDDDETKKSLSEIDCVAALGSAGPPAIRLAYEAPEDQRGAASGDAEAAKARWEGDGAHSVKIVPKIVIGERVRSEAITTARTAADRLKVWWETTQTSPERAQQIGAKLAEIDAEVNL